jgi:multiple sugar transport system substrate-binding protein
MSTLTRRQILAGGAAGAVALTLPALAACGGGKKPASATGNVTLYSDNPEWKDGFVKAGETLKGVTGYGFEPLSVPTTTEYQQVIRSSLQTPKTADVIKWWSGFRLQDLARTGGLTDLSGTWNDAAGKNWVAGSLKDAYSYKGKVYGLPIYQSYWVWFYSRSLFAAAGVQAPKTWAEFEAAAAALKAKNVTPIFTSQADGWTAFIPFGELVARVDADYYRKLTAGEASYTDPQAKQAMAIWKSWVDRGWTTAVDQKMDDAPAQMKAGKLAMIPAGTWYGATVKKAGLTPGTDYGTFILPSVGGAQRSVFVEGGAWAVPSSAPNHEAALKAVGGWLDPAVQKTFTEYLGDASPNASVVSADPTLKAIQDEVAAAKPTLLNRYWEASPPALVEGNVQDLAKFMLDPSQADSVLSSMQKRADTEWATWNKAG